MIIKHSMRFAYRHNPVILSRINNITSNDSYAGMIQDLNDLSELGHKNPDELKTIKFDFDYLSKASAVSVEITTALL